MDPAVIIGAATLIIGPSGILWFAVRFNREDAKAAVGTMRDVAAELRLELERAYKKNEDLEREVVNLRVECGALREECGALRVEVTKFRQSNESNL